METTVPPPEQKEMAELERMALEHDSQALDQIDAEPEVRVPAEQEQEQETPEEQTPDNSETNPEVDKKERKRDAQGRFLKEDGSLDPDQSDKPVGTKPDEKPETDYTKAKKESERRDRSWKALEAEKAQARAEIDAQRKFVEQQRAELERQRNAPRLSPDGRNAYSAQEYIEYARECRANAKAQLSAGNIEEAQKFDDLAEKAQIAANEAWQVEQRTYQQKQTEEFRKTWDTNRDQAITKFDETTRAELLKIGESELSKRVLNLLDTEQVLSLIPNGFEKAVELAKLQLDSELVSELRDKLKKAEAEVSQFRSNTSLGRSTPSGPVAPKTFDQMTPQEQMAWLEREAERADANAA